MVSHIFHFTSSAKQRFLGIKLSNRKVVSRLISGWGWTLIPFSLQIHWPWHNKLKFYGSTETTREVYLFKCGHLAQCFTVQCSNTVSSRPIYLKYKITCLKHDLMQYITSFLLVISPRQTEGGSLNTRGQWQVRYELGFVWSQVSWLKLEMISDQPLNLFHTYMNTPLTQILN